MQGDVIAHGAYRGRRAAAWIKDGRLADLIVDPPSDVPRVGAVFAVKVDRSARGIGGHFVALPTSTGFLKGSDAEPGDVVLAQVTGYPEPGKAPPMTTRLALRGRYAVLTPTAPGVNVSRKIADADRRAALLDLLRSCFPGITGAILRSQAGDADDGEIVAELEQLTVSLDTLAKPLTGPEARLAGPDAYQLAQVMWPSVPHATFTDFDVLDMIEELLGAHVALKGGAQAWIQPTRAFVAVDVDSGGSFASAGGLNANTALAKELPRQLLCRGLGGQIVIDLAPCRNTDRTKIEAALRRGFADDPVETALVGWTGLGHFELRRHRSRWPIHL